jgi:hypothetical protein
MQRGLPARNLHHVRMAFISYHRLNHLLNFIERAIARLVRAAFRITDRTVEIAVIVDLNQ